MTERTVHLRFTKEFTDKHSLIERGTADAIGYLSAWAAGESCRFTVVRVFGDADGNISADYFVDAERAANNDRGYEIFGQRQENGTYTYHS